MNFLCIELDINAIVFSFLWNLFYFIFLFLVFLIPNISFFKLTDYEKYDFYNIKVIWKI